VQFTIHKRSRPQTSIAGSLVVKSSKFKFSKDLVDKRGSASMGTNRPRQKKKPRAAVRSRSISLAFHRWQKGGGVKKRKGSSTFRVSDPLVRHVYISASTFQLHVPFDVSRNQAGIYISGARGGERRGGATRSGRPVVSFCLFSLLQSPAVTVMSCHLSVSLREILCDLCHPVDANFLRW
jgi:hypothetical protein